MALVLQYLNNMQVYMDKYGDPRTNPWFLMSSPLPTLVICLSYVYLVKVVGPKYMENRKAFEFQHTLIVYNFLQVIFSTWLFYEVTAKNHTCTWCPDERRIYFRGHSVRDSESEYAKKLVCLNFGTSCPMNNVKQ